MPDRSPEREDDARPSLGSSRRTFVRNAALAGGLVAWGAPTVKTVQLLGGKQGSPPPPDTTTSTSSRASSTTTTAPPSQSQGCVRTQGYWKNHTDDPTWPAVGGPSAPFFDSGMTYLEVLHEPPHGNAFFILGHQWIAAELNVAAGAALSPATQAQFDEATNMLQKYSASADIPKHQPDRARATELSAALDDFNNGKCGTPHC